MPRKKRDPGKGITIHRHFTSDADDGALVSKLIKAVLGIQVDFVPITMRKSQ